MRLAGLIEGSIPRIKHDLTPLEQQVALEGQRRLLNAKSTYRGQVWEFRGSYANVGERSRDEMGYVPRTGVTKTQAFARRT